MKNNKIDLEGRYFTTNDFVQKHLLEERAEKTFGKDWEAQDDIEQVQELCDQICSGKYVVEFQEYCNINEDIIVRETDYWEEREKLMIQREKLMDRLKWYDLFVDYVQECRRRVYVEACEYADQEEDGDE
jgi:hypothetical protein